MYDYVTALKGVAIVLQSKLSNGERHSTSEGEPSHLANRRDPTTNHREHAIAPDARGPIAVVRRAIPAAVQVVDDPGASSRTFMSNPAKVESWGARLRPSSSFQWYRETSV